MTDNTAPAPSSSPPSFMVDAIEEAEKKRAVSEKLKSREEEAQLTDEMNMYSATMFKATNRLEEQAGYLAKINSAVEKTLPLFISQLPLGHILDTQIAFEAQVDAVEDQLKAIKALVAKAREVLLPERLDEEETRTVNAASGARMSRTTRVLASIRGGHTESAYEWLRKPVTYEPYTADEIALVDKLNERVKAGESVDAKEFPVRRLSEPWIVLEDGTIGVREGTNDIPDFGSLIKETVNSSSLSSLAKELMESGKSLPDAPFNVHTKDGVSITKAKRK